MKTTDATRARGEQEHNGQSAGVILTALATNTTNRCSTSGRDILHKSNDKTAREQGSRSALAACVAKLVPRGASVSEAVLRTEREGGRRLELAPRLRAVEADRAAARVDERAGRVHAQVGVVEVPAHE